MLGKIGENLRQPKPFYVIFVIEMWERFGFYGMQAILVYYMIHKMGYEDKVAFNVYAALVALLYGFMVLGGWVGDKILGIKRTILLGAFFLAVGYFLLGVPETHVMFLGMGTIAVGNGLFKANPSSLLSKCYEEGNPRIDGAFTLYYMAINIGSFFSFAFVPILADRYGWSVGFWTSSVGLLVAIIYFVSTYHWAKQVDSPVGLRKTPWLRFIPVIIGGMALAFISAWLLTHLSVTHWLLLVIGIIILAIFARLILKNHGRARTNLIVALILMIEAIVYWVLNMQIPTSLTLYAVHNVNLHILGINLNPLTFQALNPAWIFVASPILAYFYTTFGKIGKDLSLPTKFTIGMFLCAFGFLLGGVSRYFGGTTGIVSPFWLVGLYGFISVGELLISGLGLAMVTRLVPQQNMGFMMGVWWMTMVTGSVIAGFVSGLTNVPKNVVEPLKTLPIYTHVFTEIGVCTLIFAILMALITPKLNRVLRRVL